MQIFQKIGIAFLVMIPAATVAGYVLALQSDAYKILTHFVETSSDVEQVVGNNPKIKLDYFGYSIRISGPTGHAEFSSSVTGPRGAGELTAFLIRDGEWQVKSVILNGEKISITESKTGRQSTERLQDSMAR